MKITNEVRMFKLSPRSSYFTRNIDVSFLVHFRLEVSPVNSKYNMFNKFIMLWFESQNPVIFFGESYQKTAHNKT